MGGPLLGRAAVPLVAVADARPRRSLREPRAAPRVPGTGAHPPGTRLERHAAASIPSDAAFPFDVRSTTSLTLISAVGMTIPSRSYESYSSRPST